MKTLNLSDNIYPPKSTLEFRGETIEFEFISHSTIFSSEIINLSCLDIGEEIKIDGSVYNFCGLDEVDMTACVRIDNQVRAKQIRQLLKSCRKAILDE